MKPRTLEITGGTDDFSVAITLLITFCSSTLFAGKTSFSKASARTLSFLSGLERKWDARSPPCRGLAGQAQDRGGRLRPRQRHEGRLASGGERRQGDAARHHQLVFEALEHRRLDRDANNDEE